MNSSESVTCRGCLMVGHSKDMHPLEGSIRKLFKKCCSVKIRSADHPQICVHCHRQTTAWESFKVMVKQNDKIFKRMQNRTPKQEDSAEKSPGPENPVEPSGESDDDEEEQNNESEIEMSPLVVDDGATDLENETLWLDDQPVLAEQSADNNSECPSLHCHLINEEQMDLIATRNYGPSNPNSVSDGPDNNPFVDWYSSQSEITSTQELAEDWSCPVCHMPFFDSSSLRDHLMDKHLSELDPRCPLCPEFFNRFSKIVTHIFSFHMNKFKTDEMNEDTPESRPKAKRRPKKIQIRRFTFSNRDCPICYTESDDLYQHMKVTHFQGEIHNCPLCKHPVRGAKGAIRHIMWRHSKCWTCSECPLERPRSSFNYNRHMKNKHKDIPTALSCFVCGDSMPGFAIMCYHLKTKHSVVNSCPLCLMYLGSVEGVAVHLAKEHVAPRQAFVLTGQSTPFNIPGEIRLDCQKCGLRFTNFDQYSAHSKDHSEPSTPETDSPQSVIDENQDPADMITNECDACGKAVLNLKLHQMCQFSCRFCGKRICTNKAMTKHIQKKHLKETDEKPESNILMKCSYK